MTDHIRTLAEIHADLPLLDAPARSTDDAERSHDVPEHTHDTVRSLTHAMCRCGTTTLSSDDLIGGAA